MANGHTVSTSTVSKVFEARNRLHDALEDLSSIAEEVLELSEDDIMDYPNKYTGIVTRLNKTTEYVAKLRASIEKIGERLGNTDD